LRREVLGIFQEGKRVLPGESSRVHGVLFRGVKRTLPEKEKGEGFQKRDSEEK